MQGFLWVALFCECVRRHFRRRIRKLTAAAERVFRTLAEFLGGRTEFSFSDDDSDRNARNQIRAVRLLASSRQGSHAEDFVLAQRFQSGFWNCRDCNCVAEGIEHFN